MCDLGVLMTNSLATNILLRVAEIGDKMANFTDLPETFIASAAWLGSLEPGVFALLNAWDKEEDPKEQDELIVAIDTLIHDFFEASSQPVHRNLIPCDVLERVMRESECLKAQLKELIDSAGGIKEVANQADIPLPSLKHMFEPGVIPRTSMLAKIVGALRFSSAAASICFYLCRTWPVLEQNTTPSSTES